jgi:hypothetical protein
MNTKAGAEGPGDGVPTVTIGDDGDGVVQLLRELQRMALVHPEAMRAIFAALMKEGRLFAQTADGARWKERVLRSRLLERGLLVWQTATLWLSEEGGDGATPSALVDAVASAATSPERDVLLDRLFRQLDDEGGADGAD